MATGFVLTTNLRMAISASEIANIKRQLESSLGQGIDLKINAVGSTSLKKINQEVATTTRSFTALKKKVQETDDIFEHFGKQAALSLRRYGAFLLATSGFYKLAASLGEAKDQLIDFNKQILKVAQVTSKSYAYLSDLRGVITGLSTSLGVSSKTLSEAAVTLSQAGISAEGTAEALKVLAKTQLSATFDNITNSTEGMIAVINQFGYKTGDMQRVFSQLNAVAAKYPVEAADLVTAIRKTGSSAAATGDQLEDLIGVFSAIRGTTRESADSIATGLRTIFARIQRPRTINFLKEFNVELEEAGKHVSSYESLKRIAEVYQKLPEGDVRRALIIEEVGGIRQASRVIPILTKFAEAEKIRQTALRAGTTLDKEVALAQQGLGNRLAQVGEQFLALTRKMSEQTEFKLLVEFLLRGSEAAIKFADALSQIVPIIGILGATKIPGLLGRFAVGAGQSREGFLPTLTSVKKRASGGAILSGPDGVDKVPAMLTKGEYVIKKSSAQAFGYGNLDKINKYAGGGFVRGKSDRYPGLPNIEDAGNITDIEKYLLERISINSAEVNQILRKKHHRVGGENFNLRKLGMPKLVRRLNSLLTSSNIELYRGIDANAIYDIFNQIGGIGLASNKVVGKEFNFNRFTPTTPFPDLAEQFYKIGKQVSNSSGSNQSAILKIFANKGTKGLANISQYSKIEPSYHRLEELETILAPGSRARILEPLNTKTNILPIELLKRIKKADGGYISNGPAGTDKVPAMLTKGEFVFNKPSVDRIGAGNLYKMMAGYASGGVVHLAKGSPKPAGIGFVGGVPISTIQSDLESYIAEFGLKFSKVIKKISILTEKEAERLAKKIEAKSPIGGVYNKGDLKLRDPRLAKHEVRHGIFEALGLGSVTSGPLAEKIKQEQETLKAKYGEESKYAKYRLKPTEIFARMKDEEAIEIVKRQEAYSKKPRIPYKNYVASQTTGSGPVTKPRVSYADYMASMTTSSQAHPNPLGLGGSGFSYNPRPGFSKSSSRPPNIPYGISLYEAGGNRPNRKAHAAFGVGQDKEYSNPDIIKMALVSGIVGEFVSSFKSLGEEAQKTIQSISGAALQFGILSSILKTTGQSAKLSTSIELTKAKTVNTLAKYNEFKRNPTGAIRTGSTVERLPLSEIQKRIDATDIFSGTGAADYHKLASAKTSIQMRQKYYREAVNKNRAKLAKERAALARQNSAINWTTGASAAAFAGGNALSEYGMTAARTSGQGKYRATGGGALGGAAFGASIGVAVGGPAGAAFGALVGAIGGTTIAFYEVSKAVKSFEFDEKFKRGLTAISNVNAGRAKAGESLVDIKEYFKDTLVSRLASVSGEERMSLQGQIDNALPGLEAFLNNLASGSKTFDEFNEQQSGLVGILARFTGQSIPKLEEGFSGLIKKTQEVKKVNEEYTKEQMRSLTRILEIQTIASGLTNVTSALDDFQSQVEMVDAAMSGRVSEFRPKDAGSIFEAAQRGLNPKGLTDIVKGLGLKLGEGGKDFGNEAIQVSEAIAKLPNILHRARLKGQTDDVSISKSIENDIADMPIFIRKAFKSALDSGIIGKSGEENNLSIALSTTEGFLEVVNKMGKSLEPFLDTLKELGDTTNKHVTFIEGIYAKQRQYEGALTNLRLKVIDRQQSQEDIFAQLDDRAQNIGLLRSFESRRRESFVSGGSRMTPEGIGAEIATRQANIANLDKQVRTDEIAQKRAEEASQIDKLNRLLEYMADSTNAVTIAQKALEPAIARTNTKFDLAKQFAFGDTKSRRDLGRTIYGAQAVAQGVSPERLPPTLRAQVLSFLEANKDVAMFKDKEGKAITGNKVLERAVGLERGKGEEETLREKLVKAIEEQTKAIDVQKKQALESINTLDKVISGQNETFLKELKQIFENVELGRIGAQEAGLVGKQAQLEKQQGAVKALSDIGISPEMVDRVGKSLEIFKELSKATEKSESVKGSAESIFASILAGAGLESKGGNFGELPSAFMYEGSDREKLAKDLAKGGQSRRRILELTGGDESATEAIVKQLTGSQFTSQVDIIKRVKAEIEEKAKKSKEEAERGLQGIDEKTRTAVVSKLPEVTKQYGTLGETTQADLQNKQNEINILRAEVEELKKRFPIKKAMGGAILNGQNGIDRVPAMLTKGEYVVKKSSAQAFGYGNLDKINKYADGGVVGGGTVATIAGDQLLSQSLNVLKQILTEIKKKQQLPASQLKAINLNEHWRKKSEEVAAAKIGLGQSLQSNAVAVSNKKYSHKKAIEDNAQRVATEKARLSESLAKNAERVAKKSGKVVSIPTETSEAQFARQNREETQSRISKGVEDTQRKIARDAKIARDLELGIAERDYEASQKEQDRRIKLQNTSKEEFKSLRTGPVKSPEELKRGRLELEIMQGRRRTEAVSRLERSTAEYEAEQYTPKMPTKFGGLGFGTGQNEIDKLEKQQYDIRKNTKMRIMEQDKATLREIDRNALQNNSPIPSGRFGNAVGTTTEAQSMGGVVKALQDMVQKLVGAPTSGVKDKVTDIFNGKDGLINKLSDAIGGMPSEIDGQFTHNVNVTHNGVEVMTKITPMVEEMVKKETVKAITAFLKRNGLQTELVG